MFTLLSISFIFSKSNKSKLLELEERDIAYANEISDLLGKTESYIKNVETSLFREDANAVKASLAELENKLLLIRSKADAIREDMKSIINKEVQNKEYIALNDDSYLEDKLNNLNKIISLIDSLTDLLVQRPSIEDLKHESMNLIKNWVNQLADSLNEVIKDDKYLDYVYNRLNEL